MRNFKQIVSDLVKKPPILFPLVGLFHVLWLLLAIWAAHDEPFPNIVWLQVLWLSVYTFVWLAICDLRKWAAYVYILLAVLNTLLFLAARKGMISPDYYSNTLWIDLLFSIFVLYYFKKFDERTEA